MSTTTIEAPPVAPLALEPTSQEKRDFADQLRKSTVGCRIHHEKFGIRRALTKGQISQAAQTFDAEADALTAAKKLLDSKDDRYRACVNVRHRATAYWRGVTRPFPEPGIRLLRRDLVPEFAERMTAFQAELNDAAAKLQEAYAELREHARQRLGDLFNEDDYPVRIDDEFGLSYDFPALEPAASLRESYPQLYQAEVERIRARFDEAVRLTEQALVQQFHELVQHLTDRLSGDGDGKPKTFRDSTVGNIREFFETFKEMNTGSNAALQAVVDKAQQVLAGVTPDDLRSSQDLRQRVTSELGQIAGALDGLMVEKPKRKISLEDE